MGLASFLHSFGGWLLHFGQVSNLLVKNAAIHNLPVKTAWTLPAISSQIISIISFNRNGLPLF